MIVAVSIVNMMKIRSTIIKYDSIIPKNGSFLNHIIANRYDLYLLTETWLKAHHSMTSMFSHWIKEFAVLRCDRRHRAGRGVCMIVRNTLNHTVLSQSVPKAYEILAADIASTEFRFRVVLVYRPPSTTPSLSEQLAKAISELSTVSFPVLVVGDFNMPEVNWAGDSWNESPHPLAVLCMVSSSISKSPLDATLFWIYFSQMIMDS